MAESTKKLEKAHIAARLVAEIRAMNPPGRFLKQDPTNGYWYDVGDAKAIKKMGQAIKAIIARLEDNGIHVIETKVLKNVADVWGYLLVTDGDALSALGARPGDA